MRLLPIFFRLPDREARGTGIGKNRDFAEMMWKKRENHGLTTWGDTFMIKDTYKVPGGPCPPISRGKGAVKRWR